MIGLARATWPFATLTVTREYLKLSVSLLGTVMFRQTDIVAIEFESGIKGNGIRIKHNVKGYNPTIVFYTKSDPGQLLNEIRATGFPDHKGPLPFEVESEIAAAQAGGSFPVKISAVVFFVVIWNVFFLCGGLPLVLGHSHQFSFAGPRVALLFCLLFCSGVLFMPPISQMVLKEGRPVSEVSTFLYFLLAISAFMLVFSFIFPLLTPVSN